jgi:predicted nucleic acid-binding protein
VRQIHGPERDLLAAARDVSGLCQVHPVELDDVLRGLDIYQAHPRLDARDAVLAAVALNRDLDAILTADRAFDEVGGLERIDPLDQDALATLT